jgi:hypothetical protein
MLDSTSRRPAFDRFFVSLSEAEQIAFFKCAQRQREDLQTNDGALPEGDIVSVIDCMENVWDEIRDGNSLRSVSAAYGLVI